MLADIDVADAITSTKEAETILISANTRIRHFVNEKNVNDNASIDLEVFKQAISEIARFEGSDSILRLVEIIKSDGWAFALRLHAVETAARLVESEKASVPPHLVQLLYVNLRCLEESPVPGLSRKASEAVVSIRKLGMFNECLKVGKDPIISEHIHDLRTMRRKNGKLPLLITQKIDRRATQSSLLNPPFLKQILSRHAYR